MAASARALVLAVVFLTVSTGVLSPADARRLAGAVLVERELPVAGVGAVLAPAPASRVGGAQEALVERELVVAGAGAILAPATASRVGGAQEAVVERELAVAGASAVLAPATASRVGGVQEGLAVRGRTTTGSGAVVAKKSSPPLVITGDERCRPGSSVDFVFIGRALGSAAPALPALNSQSRSPSPPGERTPDDLALHRTMAAGDGARAPLAPWQVIGIVCGVVAIVLGAIAIAVCCYIARKRRAAAAREQVLRSPASRRWVSPNELAQV